MSRKFKKGDRVIILKRKTGQKNNPPSYVDEMTEYSGKVFKFAKYSYGEERGSYYNKYCFLENIGWTWHEDWLERVDDPCNPYNIQISDMDLMI